MPAYINGQQVNGCTNYASAVTCVDKDGNKSTVQAEMDELNKKLVETVIWENPNPTSSMGEKTIDIDMTPYEGKKLEVECRYAEPETSRSLQYAKVLIGKQFYFVTGHGTVTANRRFRVEANYLKFDNAYQNGSNNANALVPLKITVLPF